MPYRELSDALMREMAEELLTVPGIEAVALGGSRARGTHTASSDYDVGVYYAEADLDTVRLQALAAKYADEPVPVAAPGEWGAWVDGGAWLRVAGTPVDWILRNVDRVDQQCTRAREGLFAFHSQPGHPLGFLDVSYAGEVATGRPLADPHQRLSTWKAQLDPYPSELREALVQNTWQVSFDLDGAHKGADRCDTTHVSLCCAHAVLICAHGLHADARSWVTNEKGLVPGVDRLQIMTGTFHKDVATVLGNLGSTASELHRAVDRLHEVLRPALTHLGTR